MLITHITRDCLVPQSSKNICGRENVKNIYIGYINSCYKVKLCKDCYNKASKFEKYLIKKALFDNIKLYKSAIKIIKENLYRLNIKIK